MLHELPRKQISPQHLRLGIECLGLGMKSLPLGVLAANRAEALDAQLLSSFHDSIEPSLGVLLKQGLALGMLLLGDNPAALALHQVRLLEACGSLLLPRTSRFNNGTCYGEAAYCRVRSKNAQP